MNSHLQYIQNQDVCLGISPEIGGTIFFLSKQNSPNLLHSDESLWDPNQKPELSPFGDFIPYNGHTIWLGPQSEWWTQQSENQERKTQKAVWPPDPYITYGSYTVENKTESSISLRSVTSPVSGVQISKEIAINPDGSIFISVQVHSMVAYPISWDIWFNTRVHGFSRAYVPVSKEHIRTEHVLSEASTEMPIGFLDGFFYYDTCMPPASHAERSSKTFLYPESPHIFAFIKNHCLHITFEKHPQSRIHPEHALVELYNHTEADSKHALLELEYHAPYVPLQPYQSMSAWQVWNVIDYAGEATEQEQIPWIQSQYKKGNQI